MKFETKEICDIFNDHFSSVGKNVAESIIKPTGKSRKYIKKKKIASKFDRLKTVSDLEITKLINNLPNKTSCGRDGLSNVLIKNLVYTIQTILCNKSFITGIFPEWFKLAKILLYIRVGQDMFLIIIDQYHCCHYFRRFLRS